MRLTELMEGSTCALLLESTQAMLEEILPDGRPPTLYIDNMAANNILNGSTGSWRTRHLRIRHSYVLDKVATGQLAVRHLAGEDQPADLPTKLHSKARLLHLLGVGCMEHGGITWLEGTASSQVFEAGMSVHTDDGSTVFGSGSGKGTTSNDRNLRVIAHPCDHLCGSSDYLGSCKGCLEVDGPKTL